MKSLRRMLSVLVFVSLSTIAFAQSETPKTDAQKSFEKLKSFAGSWDATLAGLGPEFDGKKMHVTLRVTSTGNALMHEMTGLAGRPDDPITMIYLDEGRLMLTHYCDAGNRPRMVGKMTPDGKSVDFEFLDIAGNTKYGHMHHAMFTSIDADHHTEEWTFMEGDKPVHARFELQRSK